MLRRKREKRNTIIIRDHVIRFLRSSRPNREGIDIFDERYVPSGVLRDGQIEDRDTLGQILIECVERWGLRRQPIQLCVPDAYVFIRKLSLPEEMTPREIQGHLFMELGESIPIPFSDPVFDYTYMEEEHAVIVFAAPREYAETYAAMLEEAGGRPNSADISALCTYRALAENRQVESEEHTMLLQVNVTGMVASIFHEDQPLFFRYSPMEQQEELWKIQQNSLVWMGEEEALIQLAQQTAEETEGMTRYYKFTMQHGQEKVDRIVLSGDHPYIHVWKDSLERRLGIPVTIIDVSDDLPLRFYENIGLALKKNIK
ncbi:type IV pilus biogenesis protein PilM [Alteribacillus iranensis]|nr:pilus assembly protein PilM [Alteribacillus iranensis]